MTDQETHSALVRWLSSVTTKKVIKADQGGDEVVVPGGYVVVRFTGSAEVRQHVQRVEYTDQGPPDTNRVMARPVIETEWRYSLHAIGGAYPSDILRPMRSAAALAQVNEPLMPGVIIHELSQIRNVPEYVNEKWEQRAQMDMFLRGLVKDGHIIDTIEDYTFEHNFVRP